MRANEDTALVRGVLVPRSRMLAVGVVVIFGCRLVWDLFLGGLMARAGRFEIGTRYEEVMGRIGRYESSRIRENGPCPYPYVVYFDQPSPREVFEMFRDIVGHKPRFGRCRNCPVILRFDAEGRINWMQRRTQVVERLDSGVIQRRTRTVMP
jgi:hypothetical protein